MNIGSQKNLLQLNCDLVLLNSRAKEMSHLTKMFVLLSQNLPVITDNR